VNRLKLTVYFGERDRADGGFVADALAAIFARHRLRMSVVLRGIAGFGAAQRLRTDRLLSLSEDLPVVSIAVDDPEPIRAASRDVEALRFGGLVTLERARSDVALPDELRDEAKLTIFAGRREHRSVVAALRRHGVAGATALLGVDGTVLGERRRARLIGGNDDVPILVVAVGPGERVDAALGQLGDRLHTLERVRVCRRDGAALAELRDHAPEEPRLWQKVTVYTSEATGQHAELVRRLRGAGAAGATCLRGTWGYHGDHHAHGDRLLQLRRRVPVVTVAVDAPGNVARWAPIVEEVTARTGLVTSELVPAYRERA
jgi:PII-like signaling protein